MWPRSRPATLRGVPGGRAARYRRRARARQGRCCRSLKAAMTRRMASRSAESSASAGAASTRKRQSAAFIQEQCRVAPAYFQVTLHVHADHAFDGTPADGAEADLVAREHDAILLRAEIAAALIHRSFEGADLAGIGARSQQRGSEPEFLAEQRFHLRLRAVLRADGAPPLLDCLLHLFELLLRPDRGKVDAGGQQIFPLGGARGRLGGVRLPGFGALGGTAVGDVGGIVFVGEAGKVVAEFVGRRRTG